MNLLPHRRHLLLLLQQQLYRCHRIATYGVCKKKNSDGVIHTTSAKSFRSFVDATPQQVALSLAFRNTNKLFIFFSFLVG
jgi:hypothetical protein